MKLKITALLIAAAVQFSNLVQAEQEGTNPCCRTQVVADYDFYRVHPIFNGPNADWSLFSFGPDFTANDGQITFSKSGGVLDSNPFTKYTPPNPVRELDHVKWLGLANQAVTIPSNGQVIVEWRASVETFGTVPNPFPEGITTGPNDARFAGGAFNCFDGIGSNVADFYMTNDRIYAIYERLPFSRPFLGNYAAYTFVVPLAKRKSCDWHNFSTIFDGVTKNIIWTVEGVELFRVKKVGSYPVGFVPVNSLGGNQTEAFASSIQVGFGTFTLVDFYPAATKPGANEACPMEYPLIREGLTNTGKDDENIQYNPVLGAPTLASYWDSDGEDPAHHIWGQGVVTRIKKLKVSVVTC